MATKRDPEKDISFLLAVAHNLIITSEFADTAIANWRKFSKTLSLLPKTDDLKLPTCVLLLLMAKILAAVSTRYGRR